MKEKTNESCWRPNWPVSPAITFSGLDMLVFYSSLVKVSHM